MTPARLHNRAASLRSEARRLRAKGAYREAAIAAAQARDLAAEAERRSSR